jgi:hypothetical protein
MSTRTHTTDYLAPVSMWVVIRKHAPNEVEAAVTGCDGDHEEANNPHECTAGPVIFPSRIHAELYAHFRNAHEARGDQWHPVGLEDYDLRAHIGMRGGRMPCMFAIGFSMSKTGALLMPHGVPSVLCTARWYTVEPDAGNIVFSFRKIMAPILEEWASIGLRSLEDDLHDLDSRDPDGIARAVSRAVAKTSVESSPVDHVHWGVYCPVREQWFIEHELKAFAGERSLH